MSNIGLSHGAPTLVLPKGSLAADIDTPDLYIATAPGTWVKILRAGTSVTVTGLTLSGFATGVLKSTSGVVSSSLLVAADITANTITGAQFARGGTNQVFWSANSGVDPAFTGSPILSTGLDIGTSSVSPSPDALQVIRAATSDRASLVFAQTGAAWRLGMSTGATTETRLWYSTGAFNETAHSRFSFGGAGAGLTIFPTSGSAGVGLFLSADTLRIGVVTSVAGVADTLRVTGAASSGSTGGDIAIDSGDGTTAGSVRLRVGVTTPVTRLLVNPTGTLQLSAYIAGVAHLDGSGNLTSSPVVNGDIAASTITTAKWDLTGLADGQTWARSGAVMVATTVTGLVPQGRTLTGTAPVRIQGDSSPHSLATNLTISVDGATTVNPGVVTLTTDLAGLSTAPIVVQLTGSGGIVTVLAPTIRFADGIIPGITQAQAATGSGAKSFWRAQKGAAGSQGGLLELGGGDGGTSGTNFAGDTHIALGQTVSGVSAAFRLQSLTVDVLSIAQTASGVTTFDAASNGFAFARAIDALATLHVAETSAPSTPANGRTLWATSGGSDQGALLALTSNGYVVAVAPKAVVTGGILGTIGRREWLIGGSFASAAGVNAMFSLDLGALSPAPSAFTFKLTVDLTANIAGDGAADTGGAVWHMSGNFNIDAAGAVSIRISANTFDNDLPGSLGAMSASAAGSVITVGVNAISAFTFGFGANVTLVLYN